MKRGRYVDNDTAVFVHEKIKSGLGHVEGPDCIDLQDSFEAVRGELRS